jgi:hypothetical protein
MKRLYLYDVHMGSEAFCPLLLEMPLLETLAITRTKTMPDFQGAFLPFLPFLPSQKDGGSHILSRLRDVALHMKPVACMAVLRILQPSRHTCHRLEVDVAGYDEINALGIGSQSDSDMTIVHVLEYVMDHWAHLFTHVRSDAAGLEPGPHEPNASTPMFPPVDLVWITNTVANPSCSFTLSTPSPPLGNMVEHPYPHPHKPGCSLTTNYIPTFAHIYRARGIAFRSVELIAGWDYTGIRIRSWLPGLTMLCDSLDHDRLAGIAVDFDSATTFNNFKLVLRNFHNINGLREWLAIRRHNKLSSSTSTSKCAIMTTVELIGTWEKYQLEQKTLAAAKLRESGVVENVVDLQSVVYRDDSNVEH